MFFDPDIVTIHLTSSIKKRFMEKYLCWFALREPYVPYKTLVEMMFGSTSSFSNVYGVVDYNSNRCKSMVIDAMRMNQGYTGKCLIVDEEPNADTTRFF
jgi:hypothetical protein